MRVRRWLWRWLGVNALIVGVAILTPGRPWANSHPEVRDGTTEWY